MFLWPPRPEHAIPPDLLAFYERRGWLAQIKKNGTCTVIDILSGDPDFKTRHNEAHKQWTPKPQHSTFFRAWPGWIFVAELLHNKTPAIKDELYIFDVLAIDGSPLRETTFEERQCALLERFPRQMGPAGVGALRIAPGVLLAQTFTAGLYALWRGLVSQEDEGLVLKNPKAALQPCVTPSANSDWQVKCRRVHANYSF